MNKSLQYALLTVGVLALSTSAIFVMLATAPAPIIAFYRMLFSSVLLLPFILLKKSAKAQIRSFTKKQWLYSFWAGVLLASHYVLWFESLRFTSIASSTILVTLQPIFSFIGAYWLFKERVQNAALLAGVIAIAGSFIVGWGDFQVGGTALFGDALALLGAMTIAFYFLVSQSIRKVLDVIPYTFVVYTISALVLLGYNLVLSNPFTGFPAMDWVWFVCLAIVPTFLGQLVFIWLVKWVSASTISMSILGEPVGTIILAYWIFQEHVTIYQVVGSAVILGGIYMYLVITEKKSKPITEEAYTSV